jgi:hypothetical protein
MLSVAATSSKMYISSLHRWANDEIMRSEAFGFPTGYADIQNKLLFHIFERKTPFLYNERNIQLHPHK